MGVLIYGSGVFARLLRRLLDDVAIGFVGYIDDFNRGKDIVGNYEEAKRAYPAGQYGLLIGVGYKHFEARWKLFQQAKTDGYVIPSIIHPTAYVADPGSIGAGSIVMAGAILDVRVSLGELCVVWPGACINHDTRIGRNTFVSPNATLCGCVEVGESVFVGAGAIIADHGHVRDNVFIPAGEVVGKHTPQRPRRAL